MTTLIETTTDPVVAILRMAASRRRAQRPARLGEAITFIVSLGEKETRSAMVLPDGADRAGDDSTAGPDRMEIVP